MSRLLQKLTGKETAPCIKKCRRNINRDRKSNSYRVNYRDKSEFDILRIFISDGNTEKIFDIRSSDLPDRDSIHFKAIRNANEDYYIEWSPLSIKSAVTQISGHTRTDQH